MAKQRSPNCPQITFLEAASKARAIYSKEHIHSADKKIIAEDLGYSSISGASLSVIGALRQYGLLEASGDGLRISETAVDYFELPDDAKQKNRAALKMAFRPALFHELWKQYEGSPPSEANLRHALIKKGFLPKTAEEVLRVYKENFKLIENGNLEYNDEEQDKMPMPELSTPNATPKSTNPGKPNQLATQVLAISIPRNLNVTVDVRGDELRREDVAKIKSQFNRWIEGLEEAFEE